MTELVPAVGGTRMVPAPDPVARDYLLLGLRLDQHRPGLVDAYYGPADLKAQADMESLRPPARLADDAAALRGRLPTEVDDPERRAWFHAQLDALEVQARVAAGEVVAYPELVARCFGRAMERVDDAIFDDAAAELDATLPGVGSLEERLAAWDQALTIEPDRVQGVADTLAATFRGRAEALFGLPDGEGVRVSTVRDRPWGGYNWFEGGRRSRIEINLDTAVTVPSLIHLMAHETYPGHHLEMATKEVRLVDGGGPTELAILLNNTPECLLHEGLADLGYRFAVPPSDEADTIREGIEIAGLPIASDRGALTAIAAAQGPIRRARARLKGSSGNAAFLRHADGRSHEEVAAYLVDVGRRRPDQAEQQLKFIEDPIWRTYVFVYREGEVLLGRWVDAVPEADRPARFARLLSEARSPSSIEAELSLPSENP